LLCCYFFRNKNFFLLFVSFFNPSSFCCGIMHVNLACILYVCAFERLLFPSFFLSLFLSFSLSFSLSSSCLDISRGSLLGLRHLKEGFTSRFITSERC